ncbi:uncharacterized protein [Panulirus ornatus]|uniref:uncharacterized protein n=1 Tax=Panulirus ornatus TaxID=150431 RepID=UPI003A8854C1
MDSGPGRCWVCEGPGRLWCSFCRFALYCSLACQKKDRLRHLDECVNSSRRRVCCSYCGREEALGGVPCSECLVAAYCTDSCRQIDAKNHRSVCLQAKQKVVEAAKKINEWNRRAKGIPQYLGRLIHGVDYLRWSENEGGRVQPVTLSSPHQQHKDENKGEIKEVGQEGWNRRAEDGLGEDSLRLLLLGADLKHVLCTLHDTPDACTQPLEITLVDSSPHILARDLLMLYLLMLPDAPTPLQDPARVHTHAEKVVMVFYSLFLDMETHALLCNTLHNLLNLTHKSFLHETRQQIQIDPASYSLVQLVWNGWMSFANDPTALQKLEKVRTLKLSGKVIKDVLSRYVKSCPREHQKAVSDWIKKGSMKKNRGGNFPNVTLACFSPLKREHLEKFEDVNPKWSEETDWIKAVSPEDDMVYAPHGIDMIFQDWDFLTVSRNIKKEANVVDMYRIYLTQVFIRASHKLLQSNQVSLNFIRANVRELAAEPHKLRGRFDRIASGIHADLLGTPYVLQHFGNLLKADNICARLLTHHRVWSLCLDWRSDQQARETCHKSLKCNRAPDPTLMLTGRWATFRHFLQAELLHHLHVLDGRPLEPENVLVFRNVSHAYDMVMSDYTRQLNHIVPFRFQADKRTVSMVDSRLHTLEWRRLGRTRRASAPAATNPAPKTLPCTPSHDIDPASRYVDNLISMSKNSPMALPGADSRPINHLNSREGSLSPCPVEHTTTGDDRPSRPRSSSRARPRSLYVSTRCKSPLLSPEFDFWEHHDLIKEKPKTPTALACNEIPEGISRRIQQALQAESKPEKIAPKSAPVSPELTRKMQAVKEKASVFERGTAARSTFPEARKNVETVTPSTPVKKLVSMFSRAFTPKDKDMDVGKKFKRSNSLHESRLSPEEKEEISKHFTNSLKINRNGKHKVVRSGEGSIAQDSGMSTFPRRARPHSVAVTKFSYLEACIDRERQAIASIPKTPDKKPEKKKSLAVDTTDNPRNKRGHISPIKSLFSGLNTLSVSPVMPRATVAQPKKTPLRDTITVKRDEVRLVNLRPGSPRLPSPISPSPSTDDIEAIDWPEAPVPRRSSGTSDQDGGSRRKSTPDSPQDKKGPPVRKKPSSPPRKDKKESPSPPRQSESSSPPRKDKKESSSPPRKEKESPSPPRQSESSSPPRKDKRESSSPPRKDRRGSHITTSPSPSPPCQEKKGSVVRKSPSSSPPWKTKKGPLVRKSPSPPRKDKKEPHMKKPPSPSPPHKGHQVRKSPSPTHKDRRVPQDIKSPTPSPPWKDRKGQHVRKSPSSPPWKSALKKFPKQIPHEPEYVAPHLNVSRSPTVNIRSPTPDLRKLEGDAAGVHPEAKPKADTPQGKRQSTTAETAVSEPLDEKTRMSMENIFSPKSSPTTSVVDLPKAQTEQDLVERQCSPMKQDDDSPSGTERDAFPTGKIECAAWGLASSQGLSCDGDVIHESDLAAAIEEADFNGQRILSPENLMSLTSASLSSSLTDTDMEVLELLSQEEQFCPIKDPTSCFDDGRKDFSHDQDHGGEVRHKAENVRDETYITEERMDDWKREGAENAMVSEGQKSIERREGRVQSPVDSINTRKGNLKKIATMEYMETEPPKRSPVPQIGKGATSVGKMVEHFAQCIQAQQEVFEYTTSPKRSSWNQTPEDIRSSPRDVTKNSELTTIVSTKQVRVIDARRASKSFEPPPELTPEPSVELAPETKLKLMPELKPEPKPSSELKPEPKPEPTPEPKVKPAPEPKRKPASEPKLKGEPKLAPEPKHKPAPELKPEPKHKPASEPKHKPASEPKHKPAPEPTHKPVPELKPEPKPAPEPKRKPASEPKLKGEPKPAPETKPKLASEVKPEPAPEKPEPIPAPEPKLKPTPESKAQSAPEPKLKPAPELKPEPKPELAPEHKVKPSPELKPEPKPAPEHEVKPSPELKPEPTTEPVTCKPEPALEPTGQCTHQRIPEISVNPPEEENSDEEPMRINIDLETYTSREMLTKPRQPSSARSTPGEELSTTPVNKMVEQFSQRIKAQSLPPSPRSSRPNSIGTLIQQDFLRLYTATPTEDPETPEDKPPAGGEFFEETMFEISSDEGQAFPDAGTRRQLPPNPEGSDNEDEMEAVVEMGNRISVKSKRKSKETRESMCGDDQRHEFLQKIRHIDDTQVSRERKMYEEIRNTSHLRRKDARKGGRTLPDEDDSGQNLGSDPQLDEMTVISYTVQVDTQQVDDEYFSSALPSVETPAMAPPYGECHDMDTGSHPLPSSEAQNIIPSRGSENYSLTPPDHSPQRSALKRECRRGSVGSSPTGSLQRTSVKRRVIEPDVSLHRAPSLIPSRTGRLDRISFRNYVKSSIANEDLLSASEQSPSCTVDHDTKVVEYTSSFEVSTDEFRANPESVEEAVEAISFLSSGEHSSERPSRRFTLHSDEGEASDDDDIYGVRRHQTHLKQLRSSVRRRRLPSVHSPSDLKKEEEKEEEEEEEEQEERTLYHTSPVRDISCSAGEAEHYHTPAATYYGDGQQTGVLTGCAQVKQTSHLHMKHIDEAKQCRHAEDREPKCATPEPPTEANKDSRRFSWGSLKRKKRQDGVKTRKEEARTPDAEQDDPVSRTQPERAISRGAAYNFFFDKKKMKTENEASNVIPYSTAIGDPVAGKKLSESPSKGDTIPTIISMVPKQRESLSPTVDQRPHAESQTPTSKMSPPETKPKPRKKIPFYRDSSSSETFSQSLLRLLAPSMEEASPREKLAPLTDEANPSGRAARQPEAARTGTATAEEAKDPRGSGGCREEADKTTSPPQDETEVFANDTSSLGEDVLEVNHADGSEVRPRAGVLKTGRDRSRESRRSLRVSWGDLPERMDSPSQWSDADDHNHENDDDSDPHHHDKDPAHAADPEEPEDKGYRVTQL